MERLKNISKKDIISFHILSRNSMVVSNSIFKAYDIRGIVEGELTPDVVRAIGRAIGSESIDKGERGVAVGRDGRLSGMMLMDSLKAGLIESGCHVIDVGMVPTPLVYFSTYTKGATSGVMITGSHNPPEYNGFKIMIAGETLSADKIQNLYSRILNQQFSSGSGSSTSINIDQDYMDTIKSDIDLDRELNIVVDCGNGVAGNIAPKLFESLGAKVSKLFCLVDGRFPNHHPDPSNPENLEDLIKEMIDYNGPVIFDCHVDPNENCFPMIPSGKPHNQMLLGKQDEDEDEISEEGKVLV